jgi:hypothetical protein
MKMDKKINFKRTTTLIMAGIISITLISCSGFRVPVHSADGLREVKPDNNYRYSYAVTMTGGQKYYLDDDDIEVKGNLIGIRFPGESDFRYYRPDEFQEIRIKQKNHWAAGLGIGIGAGAALGASLGYLVTGPWDSCDDHDDPGDCRVFRKSFPILGGIILGGIGGGIGAGVGAGIPKKKKVSVSPKVYLNEKKVTGAGLGISGSF